MTVWIDVTFMTNSRQMAEEVTHAKKSVPYSIMSSFTFNAILTFIMVLVFMLRAGDLDTLLENENPYIFIDITQNATGSVSAAVALGSYSVFMSFACAVSSMAAGSRMIWSFARDRGLPFWKHVRKVCSSSNFLGPNCRTLTTQTG